MAKLPKRQANMNRFLLFTLSLALLSCVPGKKGATNVSVTTAAIGTISYTGTLAIWGKSLEGDEFSLPLGTSAESLELSLPNGMWSFHVIGWDGATAFNGPTDCAYEQVELAGGDQTITLNLSATTCSDPTFSPAAFMTANNFNPVKVIGCYQASGLTGGSTCLGAYGASFTHYKVKIPFHASFTGITPVTTNISECIAQGTSDLNLPLGLGSDFPLTYEIETFIDSGCTNATGEVFIIKDGLSDPSPFHETYSYTSITELFLHSNIQNPSALAAPSSISLVPPATSPGNTLPTVTVSGVTSANWVQVFSDSNCSTPVSTIAQAAGTTINIPVTSLTANSVATLYAQQYTDSSMSNPSLCSTSSLSYDYDTNPPSDPATLSIVTSSPSMISTPVIYADGLEPGSTIYFYGLTGCTTLLETQTVSTASENFTLSALTQGTYNFSIKVKDPAGNFSGCLSDATYVYDQSPPSLSGLVNQPAPVQSTFWSWSCSETCEYRFAVDPNPTYDLTSEIYGTTTTASHPPSDGVYFLHIQAKDEAGNETTPMSFQVFIDNTPPDQDPEGTKPAFEEIGVDTNAANTIEVKWRPFIDTSGIDYYEVNLYDGTNCSLLAQSYPVPATPTEFTIPDSIGNGDYSFKVVAYDIAGNSTTSECTKDYLVVNGSYVPTPWSSTYYNQIPLLPKAFQFDSGFTLIGQGPSTSGTNFMFGDYGGSFTVVSTHAPSPYAAGVDAIHFPSTYKTYVFGGMNNSNVLNSNDLYYYNFGNVSPFSISPSGPTPLARVYHTMTRASNSEEKFCVWGGFQDYSSPLSATTASDPGACYESLSNTWVNMSAGSSPAARGNHTAVWTGDRICIWGGHDPSAFPKTFGNGACYFPQGDYWTPITMTNAPAARSYHQAVWTGGKMCIWGGVNLDSSTYYNDGSCYDPQSNSWQQMSTPASMLGSVNAAVVWTGARMCIIGGNDGLSPSTGPVQYQNAGCYHPVKDNWINIGTPTGFPASNGAAAVYEKSNNRICLYGGYSGSGAPADSMQYCQTVR